MHIEDVMDLDTQPYTEQAEMQVGLESTMVHVVNGEEGADLGPVVPPFFDWEGSLTGLLSDLNILPSNQQSTKLNCLPPRIVEGLLAASQTLGAIANIDEVALSVDSPIPALLDILSELLAIPGLSQLLVKYFRPVLVDLFGRWIPVQPPHAWSNLAPTQVEEWERKLCIVSELSSPLPELWNVFFKFLSYSPFYLNGPLSLTAFPFDLVKDADATPVPESSYGAFLQTEPSRIHRLLIAYHRLLTVDPLLPHRIETGWMNTELHLLFSISSSAVDKPSRVLAVQVYALHKGLAEKTKSELEAQWIGNMEDTNMEEMKVVLEQVVVDGVEEDGKAKNSEMVVKTCDAWVYSRIEEKRLARFQTSTTDHLVLIDPSHLSPWTALLAGQLSLQMQVASIPKQIVHVDTVSGAAALRSFAHLLSLRLPILLSSPSSAGKTHLIDYLSTRIYPSTSTTSRIVTISLADTSIDAKALLGSYVSSPTKPGTFTWVDGAVVKALRTGRWIVLEDIDKGSVEMASLFSRLADSMNKAKTVGGRARLELPTENMVVEAGEGFALIATRSISSEAPPTFLGSHFYEQVRLDQPSTDEILQMVTLKHPRLAGKAAECLLDAYQALKRMTDKNATGRASGRPISLRDLEKWAARVSKLLPENIPTMVESGSKSYFANPAVQDEVFLEAIDVFLASIHTGKFAVATANQKRLALARALAESLNLNEERCNWLLDGRVPSVEVTQPANRARQHSTPVVRIGRAQLQGLAPRPLQKYASRPYAFTKPSSILLERISVGITLSEPLLLVGETGTGKTTAVQQLASMLNRPLTVVNLSTQTESGDLFGGFKPVDPSAPARELHSRWIDLFRNSFSRKKNETYETGVRKAMVAQKWKRVAEMWREAGKLAIERLQKRLEGHFPEQDESAPRKRRKVADEELTIGEIRDLLTGWNKLQRDIVDFENQHVKAAGRLVFSFVEGPLVKALREGEWMLFDEVNLASQETLESLTVLLESASSSVVLTERGDLEPIPRHPDFRAFACMNPATDVGKKDLPPGLRARFTEIFAPAPDDDRDALLSIVKQYLADAAAGDRSLVLDVVEFYTEMKSRSAAKEIVDGTDAAPHFSMRTLTRALSFAVETAPMFGLRRALWEGCLMTFAMSLDSRSYEIVRVLCSQHLLSGLRNQKAALSQVPTLPASLDADRYIRFGHYWLEKGDEVIPSNNNYVITPSVQAKLSDLARIILTRKFPVLIQGPTSAGKTSAVEFLAHQTGHKFVRINNHEHTDIQEYLGTYASDPATGKLAFREGVLVEALRQGHWLVLDELNLAPTDVLEALNRLLDDNRELVLPETQEVVKPHPHFMLFATQNPPGLYAGRKVLSRAFRNRFLEVHFEDVPQHELEVILCQRSAIPPSYAKKIVLVFEELRRRRQAARMFESKASFATLRDLFRWAGREANSYQHLAENGYMLLAERARRDEDKIVVKEVVEQVMKVTIDEAALYTISLDLTSAYSRLGLPLPTGNIVWTSAMQRLFTLVAVAAHYDEPLLLVGETGCGKTSVCEVLAKCLGRDLIGVNCHQNMETADLLGSQRPLRNRAQRLQEVARQLGEITTLPASITIESLETVINSLPTSDRVAQISQLLKSCSAMFEWHDGPLVHAMQESSILLLDELSLADDSVLERLNSVLEPGKTLVLAEKGGASIAESTIVGSPGFQVVATMNPGGDFGKKELSPALRNRFTEIWVPSVNLRADLLQIIEATWKHEEFRPYGSLIIDFFEWFGDNVLEPSHSGIGLRDILAWVTFMDVCRERTQLEASQLFAHAAQMIIIDGLETLPSLGALPKAKRDAIRRSCSSIVAQLVPHSATPDEIAITSDSFAVGPFALPRHSSTLKPSSLFDMDAPTTRSNVLRIVRACQMPKSVLLEGSPGVGKTTLVQAIASLCGKELCRINLSDQTDLIDLFGADLPVAGGDAGEFAWSDAAFLTAMQRGDWVLLDEMNLASQAVLEGLNAVLDHRGTVFVPELGRSFTRHPDFRIFAAQNPMQQGGGRKGLPKSFLNRFTKVYVDEHTSEDLISICLTLFPAMERDVVAAVVAFNSRLQDETMLWRSFGQSGSPWEFNLRDIARWFSLQARKTGLETDATILEFLSTIYVLRFRTARDQQAVAALAEQIFGRSIPSNAPWPETSLSFLQVGHSLLTRGDSPCLPHFRLSPPVLLGRQNEAFLKCMEMAWPIILVGPSGAGKRSLVRHNAEMLNKHVTEFTMHPGVDTMEMLGSFEQADLKRTTQAVLAKVAQIAESSSSAHIQACIRKVRRGDVSAARAIVNALGRTELSAELDGLALASGSGFEWVDGPLVKAMKQGHWYLVNDANLCGAAVLDRLNGLCEPNGVLILSEKGGDTEILRPHPDFRLVFSFDPKNGELSRAMRNRGIEIFIEKSKPMREVALGDSLAALSRTLLEISNPEAAIRSTEEGPAAESMRSLIQDRISPLRSQQIDLVASVRNLPAGFLEESPFDLALNMQLSPPAPLRLVTRYLRELLLAQNKLQALGNYTADCILTQSIVANRTGSRSRSKHANLISKIAPAISSMRRVILETQLQGYESMSIFESLQDLVDQLEKSSLSTHVDTASINVIASRIQSLLGDAAAAGALQSLVSEVTTLTGRGQKQVWQASRSLSVDAERVQTLLQSLDFSRLPPTVLSTAAELFASALYGGVDDPTALIELEALVTRLAEMPANPPIDLSDSVASMYYKPFLYDVIAATTASPARLGTQVASAALQVFGQQGQVAVVAATHADVSNAIFDLHRGYLGSLWADERAASQPFGGPAALILPTDLIAIVGMRSGDFSRLGDLTRRKSLREQVKHILASEWTLEPLSILSSLEKVASHLLLEMVACFKEFLPEGALSSVSAESLGSLLQSLGQVLQDASANWLSQDLRSRLERLRASLTTSEESIADAFTAIGHAIFALYVPSIALDPAVDQEVSMDLARRSESRLEEEFGSTVHAVKHRTGQEEGEIISSISSDLEATRKVLKSLEGGRRRSDPVLLDAFYSEVHQFLNGPHSEEKLRSPSLAEEQSFQIASDAFLRRLRQGYSALSDLAHPIELAVGSTRMGLRLRAALQRRHEEVVTAGESLRLVNATTAYPAIVGQSMIAREGAADNVLILASVASCVVAGQPLEGYLGKLSSAYFRLSQAFEEERVRKLREQQEAESMYRSKTTEENVLSDVELEAKEFAELFPQYEDPEEDVEVAGAHSDKDSLRVYQLHLSLFGAKGGVIDGHVFEENLNKHLRAHLPALDHQLDRTTKAYQLRELALMDKQGKPDSDYDFYRSANVVEAGIASDLLAKLRARLVSLIIEWPDQMVLQHILDRVETMLNMTYDSPVPRLLSAFELLLTHTGDWEEYANRDNSLQSFRTEITDLIISWRRLELAGWRTILAKQQQLINQEIAPWWFRLYRLVVTGYIDLEERAPLKEIVPLLVEFLSSSTAGQFEARLDLLRSFAAFVAVTGRDEVVVRSITNVCDTYGQFLPAIRSQLQTQTAPLEKAMSNFVKLASWKDVNVHALKASAKKTHGQLFKTMRKFRAMLRQPAAPMFTPGPCFPLADPQPPFSPILPASEPVSGSALLERYVKVVNSNGTIPFSLEIDELATEIIETADELAKATPSSLTKENSKEVKALASQKRRALADLLKALKKMGFSAKVRADQLALQSSAAELAQMDVLPASSDIAQSIAKYHHRLTFCLPAMRQSLVEHNEDILTHDLQRAQGFAESAFASSLQCRKQLQPILQALVELRATTTRMQSIVEGGVGRIGATLPDDVARLHELAGTLKASFGEAQERLADLSMLSDFQFNRQPIENIFTDGSAFAAGASLSLSAQYQAMKSSRLSVLTKDEILVIETTVDQANTIQSRLKQTIESQPRLGFLMEPLCQLLGRFTALQVEPTSGPVDDLAKPVVDRLLIIAQESFKASPSVEEANPMLARILQETRSLSAKSGHASVVRSLTSLHTDLMHSGSMEAGDAAFKSLYPFLLTYVDSLERNAVHLAQWDRSMYKLTYILSQLFRTLAEKGFCKPQEQSDEKSGQPDGQMSEGTGLGAGTGSKNVSEEIEDESQVEGLQGEEEEEEEKDKGDKEDEDDDAFEMQDDFEGALDDVSGDEGEDSDGEKEDEEEMDDHVGDVEENGVDEQFWEGDDPTEKDQEGGEDEKQDGKEQEQGENSELTAKDDKEDQSKSSKDKEKPQPEGETEPEQGDEEPEAEGEEQELEGEDGEDDQQDKAAEDRGQQIENNVPEVDTLDLPEGMELEDGGEEEEMEGEEDGMSMGDEEEEEERGDGQGEGDMSDEEMDEGEEGDMANGEADEDEDAKDGADQLMSEDKEDNQEQSAQEASSGGNGGVGEQEAEKQPEGAEQDDGAAEQQEQREAGGADSDMQPSTSDDPSAADDTTQAGADGQSSTGAPQAGSSADRSRSLGDRLKEVNRMLDEIMERAEAEPEREQPSTDASAEQQAQGRVEHIKDDEEADTQALGAAEEEQGEKLADLNIVDQEHRDADAEGEPQDVGMEVDEEEAKERETPDVKLNGDDAEHSKADPELADKALTRAQVMADSEKQDVDLDQADDSTDDERDDVDYQAEMGIQSEPDIEDALISSASLPLDSPSRGPSGEDLWRKYSSLTTDLSYQLCEQLRLILEPTLATRLQGDYRTGKRLNMRKIIPYIASEYTKDKIWLRRTKPSKREYQVLLSLDDSRSMSDSQSVHLAYQTLALVSQALSKLEVGQIGIARFGQDVQLLHPFGSDHGGGSFNDAEGAKVMGSFKFDQHGTDVARLVEQSLVVLEDARSQGSSGGSGADLWQLEIIISDGVCQDHDKLRKLLRKAAEQRVMIVFLIVDSLHKSNPSGSSTAVSAPAHSSNARTSILSMQTVSYAPDPTTGEINIKMDRYLDSFPFEYYVVLRDVESLPEVLSETLRQWIQRVATSNE